MTELWKSIVLTASILMPLAAFIDFARNQTLWP